MFLSSHTAQTADQTKPTSRPETRFFEKILVQCGKRITVFQTQLALGYSVLSHRQLVPRAAVARPSGGLEGESPSSDCRRLVCSSMLLLCRGALSREKTGKEPTNISCSNYTTIHQTDSTQA